MINSGLPAVSCLICTKYVCYVSYLRTIRYGTGLVTDVRCAVDEPSCGVAIFASRASLIMCGNPLRLSGLQEASLWGNFRFLLYCYIDYTQPLHVITCYAYRVNTHIDYHLGEDPSQKTAVYRGSRIPSLALDPTLAPDSPRTKEDSGHP